MSSTLDTAKLKCHNTDMVLNSGTSQLVVDSVKYLNCSQTVSAITVELADRGIVETTQRKIIHVDLASSTPIVIDACLIPQLNLKLLLRSRLEDH